MPFLKVTLKPGVNRDQTNYTNRGGWFACDKIRFRSGQPQKLGGWIAALTSLTLGICRQMFGWITSYSDNFLALGTNSKVYIEVGGAYYDITPLQSTTSAGDVTFAATSGSSSITVYDNSSNVTAGNFVTFSGARTLSGGISTGSIAGTSTGSATFTAVSQDSTSGDGYGAEFTITADGAGGYTLDAITTAGNAYAVSDTLVILGTDLGGTSPTNNATITVTAVTSGNITAAVLNQNYEIATKVNNNQYTIIAKSPTTGLPVTATAADTGNGGPATVGKYEINIGNPTITYGYGWGTGGWGDEAWGESTSQPVLLPQRDWWFDQFDNDLVMNIRNGPIYYWERAASSDPSSSLATRAVLLSSLGGAAQVPTEAMQILVSQNNKHLICFGSTPYGGGDFDPLLIRWANQDTPQNWTVSSTTTAGDLRVARGSQIVRALATRQEILVWTESNLNSLQFTGTTDVFSLQELADNISIMGPRACISASNITFWMGKDKFYAYTGRVETLSCTLRNHVFNNINLEQSEQVVCGTNEGYNEVWWFYCSAGSTTVDKYVIYNYQEQIWYYGDLARTAWLDSPLRDYPQAIGYEQLLYNHESGVDANGAPMASYIQSSDFDLEPNGDQFMLTRRILPDVSFDGSNGVGTPSVAFAIRPRNFPGNAYQEDPFDSQNVVESAVDVYTQQVFIRARARQIALRVGSTGLGVTWQLGTPRIDARPDGTR